MQMHINRETEQERLSELKNDGRNKGKNRRFDYLNIKYSMKKTKIIMPQSHQNFPGGSPGEESICSAGDLGLILGFDPWVGRSPGGWTGYSL